MKIPLSLISEYIDLQPRLQSGLQPGLEKTLTLLGIEVDAMSPEKAPFSGVVVCEIKQVSPHPSADKLQIAEVFDGKQTLQIVCGASNCRPNILVPLAKIGAHLTGLKAGAPIHIHKTEIRGVESFGMLCPATELSLYDDLDGILELPADFPIGADLAKLLWDPVMELSFTPNLGHCMSALGIARELSAAWKKPLKKRIKHEAPLEFSTIEIGHVKVGPSPFWLQKTLRLAGVRSINNVVDVTNYFLLKAGQPMHTYDKALIEGDVLTVESCQAPFRFHGLDGKEYAAPPGTLVIADAKKVVALAGIMGGANSAVSDQTTSVLLEAASFDPAKVRVASRKIGLRSDSSARFEKGVDQGAIAFLLEEAANLICELTGGKIKGKHTVASKNQRERIIPFRPERVLKVLGTPLSNSEIKEILERLEMTVRTDWSVEVPTYRNDLHEEIDLIEEIARVYGYNNLDKHPPKSVVSPQLHDPEYLFDQELRRRLISLGLQEFLNCDLISPKLAESAQELSHSKRVLLQAIYSKSEEYSILRTSLLPGLLQTIQANFDQKNETLAGFELGRIHFKEKEQVVEIPMVAILLTGSEAPPNWDKKEARAFDFFDLKGLVLDLLKSLRISDVQISPSAHPTFHPARQAEASIQGEVIGTFGELHPSLLAPRGIKQKVYFAELNGLSLRRHLPPPPKMLPLNVYPSSERDWTIPLSPKSAVGDLLSMMRSLDAPHLEDVQLIDLYKTEDKIHATFRFSYRDLCKTLSFEEVETSHARLVSLCSAKIMN